MITRPDFVSFRTSSEYLISMLARDDIFSLYREVFKIINPKQYDGLRYIDRTHRLEKLKDNYANGTLAVSPDNILNLTNQYLARVQEAGNEESRLRDLDSERLQVLYKTSNMFHLLMREPIIARITKKPYWDVYNEMEKGSRLFRLPVMKYMIENAFDTEYCVIEEPFKCRAIVTHGADGRGKQAFVLFGVHWTVKPVFCKIMELVYPDYEAVENDAYVTLSGVERYNSGTAHSILFSLKKSHDPIPYYYYRFRIPKTRRPIPKCKLCGTKSHALRPDKFGGILCDECIRKHYSICNLCDIAHPVGDIIEIVSERKMRTMSDMGTINVCYACYNNENTGRRIII